MLAFTSSSEQVHLLQNTLFALARRMDSPTSHHLAMCHDIPKQFRVAFTANDMLAVKKKLIKLVWSKDGFWTE